MKEIRGEKGEARGTTQRIRLKYKIQKNIIARWVLSVENDKEWKKTGKKREVFVH